MDRRVPAEAFPPGEFIKEELEARAWTQADLADILGRDRAAISELVMGKRRVTPEMAQALADAFGTNPRFWLNLETAYQLAQLPKSDDGAARRARLWSKVPVREMIRRNWIAPSDNVAVLETQVKEFFEIGSLDDDIVFQSYTARKSTNYAVTTPGQAAWLFRARKLARAVLADAFTPAKLNQAIDRLRLLVQSAQEIRHVPRILAEAGVRLLVIEPLPQTRIDGACFWLDERSPVITLAMRFDRIDYFWHTLLHEVGHTKNRDGLPDTLSLDVDIEESEGKPPYEVEADRFAAETLIPPAQLDDFISRMHPIYPKTKIKVFAIRMKVDPGIVVGQLQHRGCINYANDREMLTKVRHIITEVALTDGWGTVVPSGLRDSARKTRES